MSTILKQHNIYRNFIHLSVNTEKNEVIYLGYDLNTTKTEYAILSVLAENTKKPLSAEKILELAGVNGNKATISFHISNINSKSRLIGNRPLIKNIAKIGYFLNKEM